MRAGEHCPEHGNTYDDCSFIHGQRDRPAPTPGFWATANDVEPLDTCARCLQHTEPGMACVHPGRPSCPQPCRPLAPGGVLHGDDPR